MSLLKILEHIFSLELIHLMIIRGLFLIFPLIVNMNYIDEQGSLLFLLKLLFFYIAWCLVWGFSLLLEFVLEFVLLLESESSLPMFMSKSFVLWVAFRLASPGILKDCSWSYWKSLWNLMSSLEFGLIKKWASRSSTLESISEGSEWTWFRIFIWVKSSISWLSGSWKF